MELSSEQVKRFNDDGYLIVPNVFNNEECQALRDECRKIVDELDLAQHPRTIFKTGKQRQSTDEYFMTSADKIRFFFEEHAFDDNGKLCVEKHLSLNKVAHVNEHTNIFEVGVIKKASFPSVDKYHVPYLSALHALNPTFQKITFDERVKATIRSLGFKKPSICQSMYIFKQPRIGGEVSPHQDATFLHTIPQNLIGIWIALEDCTIENGCLCFLPKSHNDGVLRRFVRDPDSSEHTMTFKGPIIDYDLRKFVPAEVKTGTMVVIHGKVIHYSAPNTSNRSRNIYTFHIVEEENTKWSEENWLQPTEDLPFMPLYG